MLVLLMHFEDSFAQTPVLWWSFDQIEDHCIINEITTENDRIIGHAALQKGIQGNCLRFDGFSTRVERKTKSRWQRSNEITIEAWIALQSLPWNWSAIVNPIIEQSACKGINDLSKEQFIQPFFLGINEKGNVGWVLNIDAKQYKCITSRYLSLLEWHHVVATYKSGGGMNIYIDGELAGHLPIDDDKPLLDFGNLLIGMNSLKMGPAGSERIQSANIPSRMIVEGLIDELKIYDQCLPEEKIIEKFKTFLPENRKALNWYKMPTGGSGTAKHFNAFYASLPYNEAWEALWKGPKHPDIVVRFDQLPVNYIFWRGTGYGGVWVTENGIMMGDQSLERAGKGKSPVGCAEHMSDKQTRYSNVRIIEKNQARVVIHWRYAISDILYTIFGLNEKNSFGEWADEYYYIYPDGVSTRHQILWTDHLSHEWQETIVLNQPGTRPEDNIHLNALSLANMDGDSVTYSWKDRPPVRFDKVDHANIQMVNLRSEYKPFIIFEPDPMISNFNPNVVRPEYSSFPWWNHWPVAQIPNDGRKAFGPGRPSHSSLSQAVEGSDVIHNKGNGSYEVISLTGMTNQPIMDLVSLARSWNQPPELKMHTKGFEYAGYNKEEKAFILSKNDDFDGKIISFDLLATPESPLVNPAFVIKDCLGDKVNVLVNGVQLEDNQSFRYDYNVTFDGINLICWLKLKAESKVRLTFTLND
jgi:hypothetical protein